MARKEGINAVVIDGDGNANPLPVDISREWTRFNLEASPLKGTRPDGKTAMGEAYDTLRIQNGVRSLAEVREDPRKIDLSFVEGHKSAAQAKYRFRGLRSKNNETRERAEARALALWIKESLRAARFGVEVAAEVMGFDSLDFNILSGVQGAGKGTNLRAIAEASQAFKGSEFYESASEELKAFIDSRSGEVGEIVTGTGGIFVPRKWSKYDQMFDKLKEIREKYSAAGELVPDDVTNMMAYLMIQKRIYEGNSTLQLDLWPRTQGQYEEMLAMEERLQALGVTVNKRMMDLRLIAPERINYVNQNRELYAAKSKEFGKDLVNYIKTNGMRIEGLSPKEQLEIIMTDLGGMVKEDDQVYTDLVNEALEAFNRMAKRAEKEDRIDANPLTMLNRIRSFSLTTAPDFLLVEGVKLVSGLQSADLVARDLLVALVGEEALEGDAGEEYIRLVQQKALEIVGDKANTTQKAEGENRSTVIFEAPISN